MPRAPLVLASASLLIVGLFALRSGDPSRGASNDSIVRLRASRDTSLAAFPGEEHRSLGGDTIFKLKGIQEFALLDFDVAPLRHRVIEGATLHLHHRSGPHLLRGTVSSVAAAWIEGRGTRWWQWGGSSFARADADGKPWADPDSDFTAVVNGAGGTIWSSAPVTAPDQDGWQRLEVDPRVVAVRAAGLSHGFALFDDVGSEYRRDGDRLTHTVFPNRFFSALQAGTKLAPILEVRLGGDDREPPGRVADLRAIGGDEVAAGTARLRWSTPADRGAAGVVGFEGRYTRDPPFSWDRGDPVPQDLMPSAAHTGEAVALEIRRVGAAGSPLRVGIRAVDGAGNRGPIAVISVRLAPESEPVLTADEPKVEAIAPDDAPTLPRLGAREVWVADPLDKVELASGEVVPPVETSYRYANHLWSAGRRRVSLQAARGESVGFQLVPVGEPPACRIDATMRWPPGSAAGLEFGLWRPTYLETASGLLPDPLVPARESVPRETGREALLVELYVAKGVEPGVRRGTLRLRCGEDSLDLELQVLVRRLVLPDRLSFVPQMNAYRLPKPPREVEYYRVAHQHRTVLNRLPYGWTGEVADGLAPLESGREWDWRAYDARVGPLLDGSAFADLRRAGQPVEALYLPLNENWPAAIAEGFRGGYWADDALTEEYRQAFMAGARAFALHLRERGWSRTSFEFYLNNKLTHKVRRGGWDRASAPWIFDEPVNFQDVWALRWYGLAYREAVDPVRGPIPMEFRVDVSRPQWQRDALDDVLGVYVVGGAARRYRRLLADRLAKSGARGYWYGAANRIVEPNTLSAAWCLEAWTLGFDGVVPWQTIGRETAWERVHELALLYPGLAGGSHSVLPSLRLKAFTRAQQDVEYLNALVGLGVVSRTALGHEIRERFGLGTPDRPALSSSELHRLRASIGRAIDRELAAREMDRP